MSINPNSTPTEIYAQLTPEQRAAVAQQFIAGMQQSDHPEAAKFAKLDPKTVSTQQLADMHEHARKHHSGLLGTVMNHPLAAAALGAFAAYEVDKYVKDH